MTSSASHPERPPSPADASPAANTVGALFREAMSRLACGVVMVTTVVDGVPWGMTVSACCSVSMTPPLLLVSLAAQTKSAAVIQEHRRFGVSILGANSVEVARFGSAPGQPKFISHFCAPGEEHPMSSPTVSSSLAHLDCVLDSTITAGDHIVFIGEVQHVNSVTAQPVWDSPLVYYGRDYFSLGPLHDVLR